MRVVERYSHLNGEEYLLVHKPTLWQEVLDVIQSVDAEACRDKVSREKSRQGRMLYSPKSMNEAIATGFNACGWQDRRQHFYVTSDAQILKQIYSLDADAQRDAIEEAGLRPIRSYNQTDFVKDRVAVEVQFGKYAFVAHDLFVKHMAFFVSDLIDVGIEVLPMKELEVHMSSGGVVAVCGVQRALAHRRFAACMSDSLDYAKGGAMHRLNERTRNVEREVAPMQATQPWRWR